MRLSQWQCFHFQLAYLLEDRYRRLNSELPDSTWTLDSIRHIGPLIHHGQTVAHDNLATILSTFFVEKAPGFVPFDDFGQKATIAAAGNT
jgi:hypothetical protein